MWPPGFDPAQLRLPCRPRPEVNHPRVGSVAEMPGDAHLVAGSWGQLPCSGFMVREGGLRGAGGPCPQAAAGSSAPVLRVLLTTVTCLSNCAQEASCCLPRCCFSSFHPPLPPLHSSQLANDSLVFPAPGGPKTQSAHTHTPPPPAPACWWRWFGSSLAPGPCWGRSLGRGSHTDRAAASSGDVALRSACYCFVSEAPRLRSFPQPLSGVVKIVEPDVFSVPDLTGQLRGGCGWPPRGEERMARPQPPASTLTRALYSGLCRGARHPCSLPSAQVRAAPACVGLLPAGVLSCCVPSALARELEGGRRNGAGLSLASEEAVFGDMPAGTGPIWRAGSPAPLLHPAQVLFHPPAALVFLQKRAGTSGDQGEASKVSLLSLQLLLPNLPTPEF
ncbi:sushi domain-containing protein 6 isoform X1 [Delphinapterus leucas]|uniref:Sushi domain-containing protein 6 isoform X1 n=1 Tax=Delphinapterus leucas TaxID=9749 RepID=A0A2Y9MYH6_DELLE|nr:sushi domain-containing protein 6 isoform X1 [Delphinapterus leucas]